MAKRDKYHPDYQKLYPGEEITPEVMKLLEQSDRKMKYMEVELKQGSFRQDPATQTAVFVPSREDSLERMREEDKADFVLIAPSPEDEVVHKDEVDRLCRAMRMLEPEEYELIYALFFEGITEREYAKRIGSAPMTIHNRKVRIQGKLKKLMEK